MIERFEKAIELKRRFAKGRLLDPRVEASAASGAMACERHVDSTAAFSLTPRATTASDLCASAAASSEPRPAVPSSRTPLRLASLESPALPSDGADLGIRLGRDEREEVVGRLAFTFRTDTVAGFKASPLVHLGEQKLFL
jgi:hypothetical protein